MCTYQHDYVTSRLVWKPIVVMWKHKSSSALTLRMDFTVKYKSCDQQLNVLNKKHFHINRLFFSMREKE